MRPVLSAMTAAIVCVWWVAASAFAIVPADDESGRIFVVVERELGDVVPLAALPPPYNSIFQTSQGGNTLSFRWRYFRSDEDGLFYIQVDPAGKGTVNFGFHDLEPAPGDRLGAAAILLDETGLALHSILVRADIETALAGENGRDYRAEIMLERPVEWWRQVQSIAFLTMKYYRQQTPDDQGVWDAMQRAVDRFTNGLGSSQRAVAK